MNNAPAPLFPRLALAAAMFLITASFGFLQPFLPLYLEAAGLTRGQIGLVTGVGPALALLVQPLLGRLSDRWNARRPLMAAAAVTAGCAYLAYRYAATPLAFALLSAVGANGTTYLNAVGAVLVGRMVSGTRGGGAAYSAYRVWGSVGYIVVALGTGWLVSRGLGPRSGMDRAELDAVFTLGPLIFFAVALTAIFVPDKPDGPSPPGPLSRKREEGEKEYRSAGREAGAVGKIDSPSSRLRERGPGGEGNLNRFLVAFFLYQFALYGASAYLSLYLKALGAAPLFITGTFAAGVICEVLVMTRVGRLTDVYGRRPALALAFLLMPLRLLLYIPATGPAWVLAVQTLHGLNFGIMGAIAVVFVNDGATERDRGVRQARLAGTGGLALALGPAACGSIAQTWGIDWMFAAMAIVGAAGAFVFLTQVRESHPSPQTPRTALLRWLA